MKAVIAIDSFKGSLSSLDSAQAVKEGIKEVFPDAAVAIFSVADGGEGTLEAIAESLDAKTKTVSVTGPLGDKICAGYGIVPDKGIAVIEMSKASGLTLVPAERRDPLFTTTRGVGEMIADAINDGCRKFVVGIGGSATNDGGVGMLKALGFGFFDKNGSEIADGAKGLENLSFISKEAVLPKLCECEFEIACDVTNPLCGVSGCSAVFARQKGADDKSITQMDGWLKEYARISKTIYPDADPDIPGSGAAGGMGFAFVAYLGAVLKSGIDLVLEKSGIENEIRDADIVVTGEGRIDSQTVMGKAPEGVARLAKKYGKPVIAFCGSASKDAHICNKHGIDGVFPIIRTPITLDEAMERNTAYENVMVTSRQVFNLIKTLNG